MRKPTKREALIGGISLAVTIVLCVLIIQHRDFIDEIASWGYTGCFLINVLTSGTVVLPGFGSILTFTLGSVLNPAIVGAVAGIGEATGAIGAYVTGYAGRGLFRHRSSSLYLRFNDLVDRHGSKAVLLLASLILLFIIPSPYFWVCFASAG